MIPLMNVQRQYENCKKEIDEAVIQVLESGQYINGVQVQAFEKEFAQFIGVRYAVSVANGTDALVIALRAAGVGTGDEVITSAMSFIATAEAITAVGAVPVFVDCTSDGYVIDDHLIEKAVNERTKAIIPVQFYGQCADMDAIRRIADRYNLLVIEDAAQAVGAEYMGKKAGSLGDIGCFSFFPTKNLGCCGDGGLIVTDNEQIALFAKALRSHGSGEEGKLLFRDIFGDSLISEQQIGEHPSKYFNYVFGYNSRLDEIQAAILRVKMKHLNQWNERRTVLADRYKKMLSEKVLLPTTLPGRKHGYYVYVIVVEKREEMRKYLNKKGIASGVYYPVPLHLQIAYQHLGYKKGSMPQAERVASHSLAIPLFPELTEDEQNNVIDAINSFSY